jgi:hypothetical protein
MDAKPRISALLLALPVVVLACGGPERVESPADEPVPAKDHDRPLPGQENCWEVENPEDGKTYTYCVQEEPETFTVPDPDDEKDDKESNASRKSGPDERARTIAQALSGKNGEIQDCLGEHGPLAAHVSVDDCGRVVDVETVIADEAIDECLMGVLKGVQLPEQELCSDASINKVYKVLVEVAPAQ